MLRFLKKWFESPGASQPDSPKARKLAVLERLATVGSDTPEAAILLNRLADVELSLGNQEDALRHYGRSIDVHMELRQFDSATAVCRKLLRVLPSVVRARCTLAWLSLGKGHLEVARGLIDEYIDAAVQAERTDLAAQQLRLMARYAGAPGLRQHLADKLRAIGNDAGAKEVEGLPSLGADGAGVLSWDPVVFAALLTPEELREAEAKGLDIRTTRVDNEDENFPMYRPPGV